MVANSFISNSKTMAKRYLLKALLLVILLIVSDRSIGYGLKWMYKHQQGGDYRSATQAIEEQCADVLILGSSRARHHYNSAIIADSLQMEVYNAGRDGCFLVYQWAQLKLIMDRYTPKMILLEVTPYDFNLDPSDYERLSGLLPYQESPSFSEVMRKKSRWEQWKCLSSIYPYNSQFLSMLTSLKGNENYRLDGYNPLEGHVDTSMDTGNGGASDSIDEEKVQLMYGIIDICKNNGIELYMITSPYYIHFTHSVTLDLTQKICSENNIPYISFLNHPDFTEGSLYQTPDHLNAEGAELFSAQVAKWLMETRKSKYGIAQVRVSLKES